MLFTGSEREEATRLLSDWEVEGDRVRISALRVSNGDLQKLCDAVAMGKEDWRDLLYAAGFANDTKKHLRWLPGQQERSWLGALLDRVKS